MRSNISSGQQEIHALSKRLFYLTAYSFTGAALMGSSIGLVVYQSQQIFFLNNLGSSLNTGVFDHSEYTSAAKFRSTSEATETKEITADTLQRFVSFLLSIWLPLSIWLVALLSTSLFARFRTIVPRTVTPRTAILTSQAVFALFWIISGGLQEVEEKVSKFARSSSSSSSSDNEPRTEIEDQARETYDNINEQEFALWSQNIQSTLVSLCLVWLIAVVLLGVATGLLTTSSTVLERQLERKYQQLTRSENVDEKGTQPEMVCLVREKSCQDDDSTMLVGTSDHSSIRRYTTSQRMGLGALVLVLFTGQMRFFQWIISNGSLSSMEGVHCANGNGPSSVSTSLTMFGLVSGMVMITIGMKLIPAEVDTETDLDVGRV
ncbi:hypothetical protein BGX27_000744 [Mortierella sp. AM989]|nr:hypothetical protein BGX27_000744 [Mortierella sp. AM989]